jgi:hypothetical protein
MQSAFVPALAGALLICPITACALDAAEVFKAADPSVVVVLSSDAKAEKTRMGSGVISAAREILTSCTVVEGAAEIVVTQGTALRKAALRLRDRERDLCQLQIEEPLPAGKPVERAPRDEAVTGRTVYVISAPRGMERAINRAMIASLREVPGASAPLMQLDLTLPPGSDGGGVFTEEGKLAGIIAPHFQQGESITYAAPSRWIEELPARGEKAIAAAPPAGSAQTPAQSPGSQDVWRPAKGDRWRYRLLDGKRAVGTVDIEVVGSTAIAVRERITREGIAGFVAEREVSPALSTATFAPPVSLPGGYQLIELSSYLPPGSEFQVGTRLGAIPGEISLVQFGKRNVLWQTKVVRKERVRVPAGEFDAWKVEAVANLNTHYGNLRLVSNSWYAATSRRAVKLHLSTIWPIPTQSTFESLELAAAEGP